MYEAENIEFKFSRLRRHLNPIRTGGGGGGGVSTRLEVFANNFGSNKGTQSKLSHFS